MKNLEKREVHSNYKVRWSARTFRVLHVRNSDGLPLSFFRHFSVFVRRCRLSWRNHRFFFP